MIALLARLTGVSQLAIEGVLLALLLLVFAGVGFEIYDAGYSAADAKCEAAALKSKLDAAEADRDNARAAAADASLKLSAIKAQTTADQERTAEYVAQLEKRPMPNGCALTDDDLRGMRTRSGRTDALVTRPARKASWPFRARGKAGDQGG